MKTYQSESWRSRHGAPPRTKSHRERILTLLRERGPRGVLASELYDQPAIYGRSPRNRVSELRKMGFDIRGQARGASDWFYWLSTETRAPQKPRSAGSTDLPLFGEFQL